MPVDTTELRRIVGAMTLGEWFGVSEIYYLRNNAIALADEIDRLRNALADARHAAEVMLELTAQMAGKLRVVSEDANFCHADYPGFAYACGELVDAHRAIAAQPQESNPDAT